MNFECHITFQAKDATICEQIAEAYYWKTSKIDGDPVLGKQVFFYLTSHDSEFMHLYERMCTVIAAAHAQGISHVREKIEAILHDKRTRL